VSHGTISRQKFLKSQLVTKSTTRLTFENFCNQVQRSCTSCPGRNFSKVSSSPNLPRDMTIEPTFQNFYNQVQRCCTSRYPGNILKSQLVTKFTTRHDYRADFSEFLQSSAAVLPWQHAQKAALRCVCVYNCEPPVCKGGVYCSPENLQHWEVAKTTKSQYPGRNFSKVSSSLNSPRRLTTEPTFENFCNKVQRCCTSR